MKSRERLRKIDAVILPPSSAAYPLSEGRAGEEIDSLAFSAM